MAYDAVFVTTPENAQILLEALNKCHSVDRKHWDWVKYTDHLSRDVEVKYIDEKDFMERRMRHILQLPKPSEED